MPLQAMGRSLGRHGALTVRAGTLSRGGWVQVSVEIIPFAMHSWLLWLSLPF